MPLRVTPAERTHVLSLRDRRDLAWSEWGPSTGKPVLFCTGAGMSGCLGFGTAVVHELGVRLLGVDRPGLGRSSAHPDKSLQSWVDDVRELVGALDLREVTAVGFSQGAPFALALGGAGIASSVALVAGQDDLGAAGYARDLVTALRLWPVAPERVPVPVDLWYGQLDSSPVHSPDHGATLATRLPAATRTVLPDEGSSLLWTHARDILRRLTTHTNAPHTVR